ncbi:GTP-binding protein ypt3 [Tritrichomonas foetus]|uniref:GTP-binding protein ypt3 n=1 Tax=Tritrichomonas foetus TaxID=1144522 RepID=A0A1J4JVN5_9EUKA|nr:GTP-binding protein ypt3 [Tritrichomonas foetus]|eukprot:OHT02762.1 GTP-binding protein ypt3 [Tritrichomonas foetus]
MEIPPSKEFKIVVLGDSGVGKTSLIQRFSNNSFNTFSESTIGGSFFTCKIKTDNDQALVSIWDTAGQEQYRSLIPTYSRGAHAALFCFDVTSPPSYLSLDSWITELMHFAPVTISTYIVGTKTDLPQVVSLEKVNLWASGKGYPLFLTSSKDNIGISDMFTTIITELCMKKDVHRKAESLKLMNQNNEAGNSCC